MNMGLRDVALKGGGDQQERNEEASSWRNSYATRSVATTLPSFDGIIQTTLSARCANTLSPFNSETQARSWRKPGAVTQAGRIKLNTNTLPGEPAVPTGQRLFRRERLTAYNARKSTSGYSDHPCPCSCAGRQALSASASGAGCNRRRMRCRARRGRARTSTSSNSLEQPTESSRNTSSHYLVTIEHSCPFGHIILKSAVRTARTRRRRTLAGFRIAARRRRRPSRHESDRPCRRR
jgi:hypothetical protein